MLRYRRVKEPAPKSGKSTDYRTSAPKDLSEREEFMKLFPWLRASDFDAPRQRRVVTPGEAREPFAADEESDFADDDDESDFAADEESDFADDDEHVDVDAELAEIRSRWEADAAEEEWFYHRILGGHWTAEHRGVVADGVAGYPRAGLPMQWAITYKWPRQFGCAYAAHGQEDSSGTPSKLLRT